MRRAILLGLTAVTLLTGVVLWQSPIVLADAKEQICQGVGAASGTGCTNQSGSLQKVLDTVINIFSVVVGIVAVVMMIVGGFKFVTASGDSSKVSSARSTIIYAIIGLVVVVASQALVQFVVVKIT